MQSDQGPIINIFKMIEAFTFPIRQFYFFRFIVREVREGRRELCDGHFSSA